MISSLGYFRFLYILFCDILCVSNIILTIDMFRKKNEYRVFIALPILTGTIAMFAYCCFLMVPCSLYKTAMFFDTAFFMGMDWLSFFMFVFAVVYTRITYKYLKYFIPCFTALCVADNVALIRNFFLQNKLLFNLIAKKGDSAFASAWWAKMLNGYYWSLNMNPPFYIHLGICYVFVGLTFLYLIISIVKAPVSYKEKYRGILISYIVVIVADMICYGFDFPIDAAVVLYPVIAGFICYYSTYSFPRKLLKQSIRDINETISDSILYYDINGSCIYHNKMADELFTDKNGFNKTQVEEFRNEIAGESVRDKKAMSNLFQLQRVMEYKARKHHYNVEFQRVMIDTHEIGSCIRLIDKTAEVLNQEKDHYSATHDELTGVLNRTGFFEAVDNMVAQEGTMGRVMICSNIKDFKVINELFGDKFGDDVILNQASILRRYAKNDSVFGRIGDDRYALYTKNINYSEEMMNKYVETLKNVAEGTYQMHVLVGVYVPNGRSEKCQSMCDKALMAINENDDNYNKIFSYYDKSLMDRLLGERSIADEFENAISTGKIEMYLQPIFDLKKNTFGAEALCRWKDKEKGMLLPSEFIPILEKNGLIYQLDEFIWESAAKKLSEWNQKGFNDCYISVNVSVKDFFYADIYKLFTRFVEDYDINPSCLHIEITETILMSDFEKSLSLINKLQKFGFFVAVDNFGNGYSSLNMLKDVNTKILKIDMALLKGSDDKKRNRIILEAIVTMARNLNMIVVGEGVENKEQYDLLRKLKCMILQGNYLSEPLSVKEFEEKFIKYVIN